MSDLKNCPFCGHAPYQSSIFYGDNEEFYKVGCMCGIETAEYGNDKTPIRVWNRRV
jgi:hypothetical protein